MAALDGVAISLYQGVSTLNTVSSAAATASFVWSSYQKKWRMSTPLCPCCADTITGGDRSAAATIGGVAYRLHAAAAPSRARTLQRPARPLTGAAAACFAPPRQTPDQHPPERPRTSAGARARGGERLRKRRPRRRADRPPARGGARAKPRPAQPGSGRGGGTARGQAAPAREERKQSRARCRPQSDRTGSAEGARARRSDRPSQRAQTRPAARPSGRSGASRGGNPAPSDGGGGGKTRARLCAGRSPHRATPGWAGRAATDLVPQTGAAGQGTGRRRPPRAVCARAGEE